MELGELFALLGLPATPVSYLCAGLTGLVLWGAGRIVAPAAATLVALVVGLIAGLTIAPLIPVSRWIPALVGAGLGAAIGWSLMRLWTALLLALLLGAAIPVSVAAARGEPLPGGAEPKGDAPSQKEKEAAWAPRTRDLIVRVQSGAASDAAASVAKKAVAASVPDRIHGAIEATRRWLENLEPKTRRLVMATGIAGLLGGLVVGLLFPRFGAAVISSALGTLLMAGAVKPALESVAADPSSLWPERPGTILLALGVVAGIGLLVQLAMGRRARPEPEE